MGAEMAGRFLLATTTAILIGCGGGPPNNNASTTLPSTPSDPSTPTPGTGSGSLPTAPPVAPTVTDSAPLALSLYTVYEGTKAVNNLVFAETGTTSCGVTTSAPHATCTVNVPEGRLYFSDLSFVYSWTTTKCKIMIFHPYYYRASNAVSYIYPGATSAIDCTGQDYSTLSVNCFGGAATSLVGGFPKYDSTIYIPDESVQAGPQSATQTVGSAHKLLAGSNRLTVNDLNDPGTTTFSRTQLDPLIPNPANTDGTYGPGSTPWFPSYYATGDGYVPELITTPVGTTVLPTYHNYVFECRDDWFDPQPFAQQYTLTLFVKDIDSSSAVPGTSSENHIHTWSYVPN